MKKPVFWMALLGSLVLNACATLAPLPEPDSLDGWSSSDPLSIPYDIRLNLFKKGNLVVNPSFEQGRATVDGGQTALSIKGWDAVGKNVSRVDQKSRDQAAAEVPHGRYAVKISRRGVGELEKAEGMLSDYIPVIPGNYDFTCLVRLKDISGSRRRLALPLDDAVTFKVFYFDADKNPLTPGYHDPVSKTVLDNSDKSYAFAHYGAVDDFPWGLVRPRTYNYPFSEGDLPDRTRFVRLFLGLKGNGTMWVDDIVYRYSKWNFTARERFAPYFGRRLPLKESIIPTPRHFQAAEDVIFYTAGSPLTELPIILLPTNPAPAEQSAAALLQKKINALLARALPGHKGLTARVLRQDHLYDTPADAKLIISIGQNSFFQRFKSDLSFHAIQGKSQGYIIQPKQVGRRHFVFLAGETPLAHYYAAASALQLFDNERLVYHSARVIDYPDFLERAYAFKKWKTMGEVEADLKNIEHLSFFKLNKAYVSYIRSDKIWQKTAKAYLQGITAAGRRCRQSGVMSLAVMANPYSHFPFEPSAENLSPESKSLWTHSDPGSLDKLKQFYRLALDAGAETIMLLADDHVPHYGKNKQHYALFTEKDQQRFMNLQNAQAHVINNLKQWLDRDYPGTRLEFCPPWYANELIHRGTGKALRYFKELIYLIPPEVVLVWTGPTIRSLTVDMADLHRYWSIAGRWPMFWDNTLYARSLESKTYGGYPAHYPGKVRMCNLFEPYDVLRPEKFYRYSDGRRIFANGEAFTEIYQIKYATFADYAWNTAAYHPERSLWKVLCAAYGPAAAETLLHFSDAYYGLIQVCLKVESAGWGPELTKEGLKFIAEMTKGLKQISSDLPEGGTLLLELHALMNKQKKRFENLPAGDRG